MESSEARAKFLKKYNKFAIPEVNWTKFAFAHCIVQCADCALKHAKVHFCEIGLFLLEMQGPCFNLIRTTNKKNSFIKGGIQV